MAERTLTVKPVVSYPPTVEVGKQYLVTVDLEWDLTGSQWPYAVEEYTVTCALHGSPWLHCRMVETGSVVLHRFGGTYGPAEFVLSARVPFEKAKLWLTLFSAGGAPIDSRKLGPIEIVPAGQGPATGRTRSVPGVGLSRDESGRSAAPETPGHTRVTPAIQ